MSRRKFEPTAGCHVLVTGGSSGIGRSLALQLARQHARISLVARRPGPLAEARAAMEKAGGPSCFTATADVSRRDELERAIAEAEAAHGPIDLLITSAGIAQPGRFGELEIASFERAMEVNYFGTLYAIRRVLPSMLDRRRGHLCLIASGAALMGLYGYTSYAASKFAVRGLAESLRGELAGTDVGISVAYPPDTDTAQYAEECRTKPAETRAITAAARLWQPDEVARSILNGLRRGQFRITQGWELGFLARWHSTLAPLFFWHFDRLARGAPRQTKSV